MLLGIFSLWFNMLVNQPNFAELEFNKAGYCIDVEYVSQLPELPTGCEITSLTTVLNYYGFDVTKEEMATDYLTCGKIGTVTPYQAFLGTPFDKHSFGCYEPVIEESAVKFLSDNSSDLKVKDLTGTNLDVLEKYLQCNIPVVFWGTINMKEAYLSRFTWNIDGENFTWISPLHCLVLIGYTEDTYIFSDPLVGITEYDKSIVQDRYKAIGKQSLIVYR